MESSIFKNNVIKKKLRLNHFSYKTWRYFYLLVKSSANRYATKRYWARSTTISTAFVGDDLNIYSGKQFLKRSVNKWMVGFKVGEFVWNRKIAIYKAKQKRKKKNI